MAPGTFFPKLLPKQHLHQYFLKTPMSPLCGEQKVQVQKGADGSRAGGGTERRPLVETCGPCPKGVLAGTLALSRGVK